MARAALLAGPAVLAFDTGGYLDAGRARAGVVAWVLAAAGLALGTWPRGRWSALAVGGAVALAAWTLLSTAWAPVPGPAWDSGQRAALYAGALIAACTLLRGAARRRAEPALLAGVVVVVGYGLSERLLPGLLHFARSASAEGRLEQPLTYWNAMGLLGAVGLVLAARIAGDVRRPGALRAAAAASAPPLGLGVSLTVSRGALFAAVAGVLALVVAARRREQVAAVGLVAVAGVLAALSALPFDAVTSLAGNAGTAERDGVLVLAALVVLMAWTAVAERLLARRPGGPLGLPRHAPAAALAVVLAVFALALVAGTDERRSGLTPGAQRLTTLQSNRYEYWKVAGRAFADRPLQGVGAGGFAVRWRAERPFPEQARDAHSLYFETAAELGLVGVALLGACLGGVALAARDAVRADAQDAAGFVAVCATWAAHVALDWDFEMPAVTLPAVIAAGALLAASYNASATRGASRRNSHTARTQTPA